MSFHPTQGFALHSFPYSESDKITQFYTHRLGKVKAVVKGARKPKSRLSPLLELFTESSLTFHKKSGGDLYVLGQARILNGHSRLKEDFQTITLLQVMADVLLQSLHDGEPQEELYRLLREALGVLEDGKETREQALAAFCLRFLELSGYPLELDDCAECQGSLERKRVFLIPHRGGALCENCCSSGPPHLRVSPAGLQVLRKLRSLPLGKVHILKLRPSLLREVLLAVLEYVAQTVEKPLKSVDYYLRTVTSPKA